MRKPPRAGRPRTSRLTRTQQLRAAKRAQRIRERDRGLASVELRLPAETADRLRVALGASAFDAALERLLEEVVVDFGTWPVLRELAWNRSGRYIAARDALALYERNWRFVDPARLGEAERALIERLKNRYGAGVFDG